MSVFRRLNEFPVGRVVLLNFLHGFKSGHFQKGVLLVALITRWNSDVLGRVGSADAAGLSDILSCLYTAYRSTVGDQMLSHVEFPLPAPDLGSLSRISEAFRLALDEDHCLLNRSKYLTDPTVHLPAWLDNPNSHRIIEALNGHADAIRVETQPDGSLVPASVRGPLPLSWTTSRNLLSECLSSGGTAADTARNGLGLTWDTGTHLYQLDYPETGMQATIAKRPTFAEANDNPFFRARRDTDADTYGRTADLRKVSAEEPQIEGLPEILVEAEPMTVKFHWKYVGEVEGAIPHINQTFFEQSLIEGATCDAACDEAIRILDDLAISTTSA